MNAQTERLQIPGPAGLLQAAIDSPAGAPVGVFAGLNSLDYQHRLMHMGVEHVDAYSATGTLLSTASGRISYSLGFRGPCVSNDLPSTHCGVFVCQSRTLTSFPTA